MNLLRNERLISTTAYELIFGKLFLFRPHGQLMKPSDWHQKPRKQPINKEKRASHTKTHQARIRICTKNNSGGNTSTSSFKTADATNGEHDGSLTMRYLHPRQQETQCQQTGLTSNQCRANKPINLVKRDDISDVEQDDEFFIGPDNVLDDEGEYNDEGYSYVACRLVLASPKRIEDT